MGPVYEPKHDELLVSAGILNLHAFTTVIMFTMHMSRITAASYVADSTAALTVHYK